jgi:hypothetical protein
VNVPCASTLDLVLDTEVNRTLRVLTVSSALVALFGFVVELAEDRKFLLVLFVDELLLVYIVDETFKAVLPNACFLNKNWLRCI